MREPVNVENKKQNRQPPPRSLIRIAGEILAGAAAGLAVALPVAYVIYTADTFQNFGGLGIFVLVVPVVYGLGSGVGVYLAGNRGNETGSFLVTLVGGFLGGPVMIVMLPVSLLLSGVLIVGVEKIVLWALRALLLLIPPSVATLGFNLTRRYKQPPSS